MKGGSCGYDALQLQTALLSQLFVLGEAPLSDQRTKDHRDRGRGGHCAALDTPVGCRARVVRGKQSSEHNKQGALRWP